MTVTFLHKLGRDRADDGDMGARLTFPHNRTRADGVTRPLAHSAAAWSARRRDGVVGDVLGCYGQLVCPWGEHGQTSCPWHPAEN